jgi:hypothetical protein
MKRYQTISAIAALGMLMASLPAFATGEIVDLITEADEARLEAYDQTLSDALKSARTNGSADDIAAVDAVVEAPSMSFDGLDLTGRWQCRTMKLGGAAGLVVYGWFACEVTDDGSGWRLTKITGSQRTVGRFFTESDTRLTYLGSFHVAGEAPKPYGSGPESDQAGYVTRTGERSWWIGLPKPYYESEFDILELR